MLSNDSYDWVRHTTPEVFAKMFRRRRRSIAESDGRLTLETCMFDSMSRLRYVMINDDSSCKTTARLYRSWERVGLITPRS